MPARIIPQSKEQREEDETRYKAAEQEAMKKMEDEKREILAHARRVYDKDDPPPAYTETTKQNVQASKH